MRDLAITRGSGPMLSVSPVALLCAASAPFWSGQTEWAPRLVDGMAAGGAVALASLLGAMVQVVVLDWLAERQSARARTAIGTGADEPVVVDRRPIVTHVLPHLPMLLTEAAVGGAERPSHAARSTAPGGRKSMVGEVSVIWAVNLSAAFLRSAFKRRCTMECCFLQNCSG
jgi:hypothetical protein